MCVLGGCDYTNNVHINGMGVATACRLVTQLRTLKRVLEFLCRDKKWSTRFPAGKEEVVLGHIQAEQTFLHHKVFDPKSQRVVLICSDGAQEKGIGIDTVEEKNERAIEIASGLIDPRTGAPRNTALSPAECELIRECQHRAFNGLEAQQLKAQAVANKEAALRSQAAVQAAKEAVLSAVTESTKKAVADKPTHKSTGYTVRIAAPRNDEAPPSQIDRAPPSACTQEAVLQLDAFAALPTHASSSNKSTTTADKSAASVSAAKRLLQDMTPQGFQVVTKAALATDIKPQPAEALSGSNLASCREDTPREFSETPTDSTEADTASSTQESAVASVACSLSQFAFKWETSGAKENRISATGRRDVITKTRFAHRTKLLFSAKQPALPFSSTNASIGTMSSAADSCIPPSTTPGGKKGDSPADGPPSEKRKSVGFLKADDTQASSAALSIRFLEDNHKKQRLL
ncbi:putative exonuclease [Cyclospora cayetanensis]|uniref:Exonuclease n=1 Tax=Cyclospora cayetanensis TaxID=88456 RepID=A0A1D3D1R2_9EIME|nr:putative exonuclease [Cyclospora cayetanensis]